MEPLTHSFAYSHQEGQRAHDQAGEGQWVGEDLLKF